MGIVAPASNVKPEQLEAGCAALRDLGYKPFYFDSIFERDLYFAGSAMRRARELEEMFIRDEVRAIVCARGGYGANYLLDILDLKKIKAHPKIFVGYSDLTTLLTYFTDATGLITFHGPMVAKDFAHAHGVDRDSWERALNGSSEWALELDSDVKSLVAGSGEGILYGGCLSILVASLGTPYEIRTAGTILFIEDIAAKPYQIDRMLMHLKLAGKLADIKGIIFGEMLDCSSRIRIKATGSRKLCCAWSAIWACLWLTACAPDMFPVATSLYLSACMRRWRSRAAGSPLKYWKQPPRRRFPHGLRDEDKRK